MFQELELIIEQRFGVFGPKLNRFQKICCELRRAYKGIKITIKINASLSKLRQI